MSIHKLFLYNLKFKVYIQEYKIIRCKYYFRKFKNLKKNIILFLKTWSLQNINFYYENNL